MPTPPRSRRRSTPAAPLAAVHPLPVGARRVSTAGDTAGRAVGDTAGEPSGGSRNHVVDPAVEAAAAAAAAELAAATAEADEAVREILRVLYGPDRPRLVLVPSVPGAGKTDVLKRLALAATADCHDRVIVCTNTNAQTIELLTRLVQAGPSARGNAGVYLLPGDSMQVTRQQAAPWAGQVKIIERLGDIHPDDADGPFIVFANADKWAATDTDKGIADLLLVDEAWQLMDTRSEYVLGLAERAVLVGDDGQLDPVVTIDTAEWAHLADGPHRPAPEALLARCTGPGMRVLHLPVTRRLPADTVPFVEPFYPGRTLRSVVAPGERRFLLPPHTGARSPYDPVLEAMAAGDSVSFATLPEALAAEDDPAVAGALLGLVRRALSRGAQVQLSAADGPAPLLPEHVMVLVSHRTQRSWLERRVPAGVLVGTADELQGLQAPLTFAWHPLSGLDVVDGFHSAAGRACVMLSRHQVAHCMVGRAGTGELLMRSLPTGPLVPGLPGDDSYRGWAAHLGLINALTSAGRIHPLP